MKTTEEFINNLKVEKNVPLVEFKTGYSPWPELVNKMFNGDSILFKEEKVANRFKDYLRRSKIKGTTRKMKDGWRVWYLGGL